MKQFGNGWRAAALGALTVLLAACDPGTEPSTPTAIAATTATSQQTMAGTAVAEAPSVRVTDQNGAPMANVAVNFTVTGGGTVATPAATTNAQGVASAGTWTLGTTPGVNTVTATVAGLTPVTFTATGQNPCSVATPYSPLTTLAGGLAAADCRLNSGEYIDFYSMTLSSAQAIQVGMNSTAVDAWLEIYDASNNLVAVSDDASSSTTNALVRMFAPSGTYTLAATSYNPGEVGAYQIASAGFAGNVSCNEEYWVIPGVTITGAITTADCNSGGYLSDDYLVVLYPGRRITVRMESNAFDTMLELYGESGLVASNDDGAGGTNSLLSYTNTGSTPAVFLISATSFNTNRTGAYTLTVTRT